MQALLFALVALSQILIQGYLRHERQEGGYDNENESIGFLLTLFYFLTLSRKHCTTKSTLIPLFNSLIINNIIRE